MRQKERTLNFRSNMVRMAAFSGLVFIFACIFLVLLMMVIQAKSAHAYEYKITFAWDADTASDTSAQWEELHFYQRTNTNAYNYEEKAATLLQTYVNGLSTPTEKELTIDIPDGEITTFFWVLRAAANGIESVDSEEVFKTFDLTPIAAFTFTAVYDAATNTIIIEWAKTDDRIILWTVYYGDSADGTFTEYMSSNDSLSVSAPADEFFPVGKKTTKYFTVQAYAPYGVLSGQMTPVALTLNRIPPNKIINFKIKLE